MKQIVKLAFLLCMCHLQGQYSFTGQSEKNKTVYLSVVEDYRKLSRIYLDQIINKTTSDSLGHFKFEGNNLLGENRIYSIHSDDCPDDAKNTNHFFGRCDNSRSILFLASNKDTITFPATSNFEILCDIISTNKNSDVFLEIEELKEEMIFDFTDFRSEASIKLNSKKWFAKLQDFGKSSQEPLVELYIYDFLSDKRNETHSYYLQDLDKNSYYDELLNRLNSIYPNTSFTQLYEAEIKTDKQLATFSKPSSPNLYWIFPILLGISLILNFYLISKQKASHRKQKDNAFKKLTQQEQKIVSQILENKTNKEIASEMFISLSTVKTHINNLYKKLDVGSREDIKHVFLKNPPRV
ncbi:MAG: helix-turn-helix transcriptional regulator [Flavobacteriaceae bacterium]|nr:MAG: helix-turn-helix transcriptional regulator [Flavobacteriaceae bacterium]